METRKLQEWPSPGCRTKGIPPLQCLRGAFYSKGNHLIIFEGNTNFFTWFNTVNHVNTSFCVHMVHCESGILQSGTRERNRMRSGIQQEERKTIQNFPLLLNYFTIQEMSCIKGNQKRLREKATLSCEFPAGRLTPGSQCGRNQDLLSVFPPILKQLETNILTLIYFSLYPSGV